MLKDVPSPSKATGHGISLNEFFMLVLKLGGGGKMLI
jgi:hypothetical protein